MQDDHGTGRFGGRFSVPVKRADIARYAPVQNSEEPILNEFGKIKNAS
jgi:hypothetical protein